MNAPSSRNSALADEIEALSFTQTGNVQVVMFALPRKVRDELIAALRAPVSERPAITLNGGEVAAPCALDGCALMRGRQAAT